MVCPKRVRSTPLTMLIVCLFILKSLISDWLHASATLLPGNRPVNLLLLKHTFHVLHTGGLLSGVMPEL
jgi:hypothetical protein